MSFDPYSNQAQKSKLLEDKMRVLQNARDDLQQHASNQSQAVAELQARNNNLTLEVDSLKRHLQEMTQVCLSMTLPISICCLFFLQTS